MMLCSFFRCGASRCSELPQLVQRWPRKRKALLTATNSQRALQVVKDHPVFKRPSLNSENIRHNSVSRCCARVFVWPLTGIDLKGSPVEKRNRNKHPQQPTATPCGATPSGTAERQDRDGHNGHIPINDPRQGQRRHLPCAHQAVCTLRAMAQRSNPPMD